MINFDKVDDLLNLDNLNLKYVIYSDTDSQFVQLPVNLITDQGKAIKYINTLQDTINNDIILKFLNFHNIKIREKEEKPLLLCDFKNEYMIKAMILYSKKRYISIIINRDIQGNVYYDVDLKGVDGKRATNAFVKVVVDNLIEYLKVITDTDDIYNRDDILKYIIIPYKEMIYSYKDKSIYENIDFFGMPVNVNKNITDLKTVAGYYKGTLFFDIATKQTYWQQYKGKAKWLKVKLKNESYITEMMNVLERYPNIKIRKKPHDLLVDLTIPEEYLYTQNNVIKTAFNIFEIDYDEYYRQLVRKISLLYKPFDIVFCDKLDNKIKKTLSVNSMIFTDNAIFTLKE